MLEKVFNNSTILKEFSVHIDGVEFPAEDVISIEITQSFYNFQMKGMMKISDTYDVNSRVTLNGENKLSLTFKDFSGVTFNKSFVIVGVQNTQHEERFNVLDLALQDEISYILENSYISKGFSDTPVNAFKEYLTHLGIDDLIASAEMTYKITDTSAVRDFTVPQNVSVLEFFTSIFREENIRLWQDRSSLYVSEVKPNAIPPQEFNGETVVFTNHTLNNEYLFKIHEFVDMKYPVQELNHKSPRSRNFRYNYNKEIIDTTKNLPELFPDLKLNTVDTSNLQQTQGEKFLTQSFFTTDNQDYDLFNTFMGTSTFSIVVPGVFEVNNVGKVIEIEMKGNNIYSETQLSGDIVASGKYFITLVQDKIIGGKYINKLKINRVDTQ